MLRLPAWLLMEFDQQPEGVKIIHTVKVGFTGIGKILDPFLRLYFSDTFITALDHHAQIEFPKLGEILISQKVG